MERHKCKLCSRSFANGRALGGHMKAHLATLPLPPKPYDFSFAALPDTASVLVQDRESETESKNPTRQRSKRNRNSRILAAQGQSSEEGPKKKVEPAEAEPVVSSISVSVSGGRAVEDQDEDVAMCLVMLSRDTWRKEDAAAEDCEHGIKFKKVRGKAFRASRIFECPFCFKVFGSGQALGGHKRSHLMDSGRRSLIDLNLPAPAEQDDELSVVSDA